MDPPVEKKSKLDSDASYIPVQNQSEGSSNLSLIFSLKDRQGALVEALKPFQVSRAPALYPYHPCHIIIMSIFTFF